MKTWSISRYYKYGYLTDELGRPNKNDINHILKLIGFDSIDLFNQTMNDYGILNNKQIQDKVLSIFDISKPTTFDEIMICKNWFGLKNDIKFPFELSPNVSEKSINIMNLNIEQANNKEKYCEDILYFNIKAEISHSNYLQPRKDSFDEICSLLVNVDFSEIEQLTKDHFDIINSYIYEETGDLKLLDNEDFLEKIFDQVYHLPENIFLETKKLIIDQKEVIFFVTGEQEYLEITPDFL
tara:strand:- start:9 stop:725 length:717 start_codon:yes stop_codon:yes gene_type:complete